MTAQLPEELILNGKMRPMQFCPPLIDDPNIITIIPREEFEKEIREQREKMRRESILNKYSMLGSTACWRNYIGTWEIKDGKFYLIDLKGRVRLTKKEPVHATWFSGVLKVPEGKLGYYIHSGFKSLYEKEIHITIEKGIVTGQTIIDNRKEIAKRIKMIEDSIKKKKIE